MADGAAGSRANALAVAVWLAIFALSLLGINFLNDHFDRISRGRQILVYGDHPFADFRDPGYFLTLYVSAAAQAATGGGLLGEALVTSAAIAVAGALTFWLAASASGSLGIGIAAAFLTWVAAPRYYDYDKVLFYMAGLALCWRYVDAPTPRRLAAAGCVTALAACFRYDNGLYLGAACLVAIAIRQRGAPSRLAAHVALYLGTVVAALAPALLFIHFTAGLPEAFRQIATYAVLEGERSDLFALPPLALDSTSLLYLFIVASGPSAIVQLGFGARHARSSPSYADAKILAAGVLCACVCVFVLRDPIGARLGAAAPVAAVLAAWTAGQWRSTSRIRARSIVVAAVCVAGVLAVVYPQQSMRALRAPLALVAGARALASDPRESPPIALYFPDTGALDGLVRYLRTCTAPEARVLVTWFAPEVFFFAERGFAGGMAVFLGTHWSSEGDQRRTVEQMRSQDVPVVVMQTVSEREVRLTFPHVSSYLDAHYRLAGVTSFGDPRGIENPYRVLIRRDRSNAPADPEWMLPCPR